MRFGNYQSSLLILLVEAGHIQSFCRLLKQQMNPIHHIYSLIVVVDLGCLVHGFCKLETLALDGVNKYGEYGGH